MDFYKPHMEASSLADVQELANSPPLKPSLARIPGNNGLTLYIARVPGSQDVFLTTLKPRDKVVSAHDVESSLYYCHRQSEHDEVLAEDSEDAEAMSASDHSDRAHPSFDNNANGSHPPPVPPHQELPGVPRLPPRPPPQLPPRPGPFESFPEIKRKPVGPNNSHAANKADRQQTEAPALPLRPQGPRLLNDNLSEAATSSRKPIPTPLLDTRNGFENAPPLPTRPASGEVLQRPFGRVPDPYPITPIKTHNAWDVDFRPRSSSSGFHRSPYSLDDSLARPSTAVRTSPSTRSTSSSLTRSSSLDSRLASGSKEPFTRGFNVILIRRDPATGIQSNIGKITIPPIYNRYGKPGKALLQLFNPGYEKFRATRGSSTADLVRCISEDDSCTYSCDLRLATRRRSVKGPSTFYGDVPVNQLIAVTPAQAYSFVSPWNRVCEFSTGVSGRSLKCRHMLGGGLGNTNIETLSELRFNTPSSSLFTKGSPKRERHHSHSASTRSVAPPHKAPVYKRPMSPPSHDNSSRTTFDSMLDSSGASAAYSQDDEDWDIEPMNLALGQERAGGGMRGNKAKLGKLVIEPEGMSMLDLLVAANMGVWWSAR